MCYNACKEGFLKGYRKLIGLDKCHLKGPYQGTLLIACGLDGKNHYFSITFVVVHQESKDNWVYFLTALRGVLGDDCMTDYTFIANRCRV